MMQQSDANSHRPIRDAGYAIAAHGDSLQRMERRRLPVAFDQPVQEVVIEPPILEHLASRNVV